MREFLLTRMDANGDCWGDDAEGSPFRASGPVPGDAVALIGVAQRTQVRRAYELVRGAPERRAAPCPVQRQCGGCRLMPLNEAAQQRVKLEILRAELERRGICAPRLDWHPASSSLAYRNRIRLRLAAGKLSFFNQDKDEGCVVLAPTLQSALERLRGLEGADCALCSFSHCEVRAHDLDGRPALALSGRTDPGLLRAELAELQRLLPEFLLGVTGDPAIPAQRRLLGALEMFVPLDAFLQVNDAVNERLIAWVVNSVRALRVGNVLDLFAGAGNFSLPLAAAGSAVTAVERHGPCITALGRSAARAGVACEGVVARADEAVSALVAAKRRFDCVVVDAPRAGAGALLARFDDLGVRFVVLCSCYAPSFARDLAALLEQGFRIRAITIFDMFPQTHHVECVAVLAKE
ncbi:MAG TPA: hypothetical protein VFQ35_21535 [Polyangiaceae bacterium]|nr:hypothetical protein [Polyangiaceae bacterium]